MKRSVIAGLAVALAATAARAGPAESAIVAAMKLPDAPNYSWVTTVDDDARSYEIVGQTDRVPDYSLVTMPMVAAMRRRVSRSTSASDNQTTVLFKGDERFVVQTEEGWKQPEEMFPANARGVRGGYPGGGYPGGGYPGGGFPGGSRGRGRRGGSSPFPNEDGSVSGPAYSNLQKTLSRPHDEIGIIVAGYTDLKVEDGVITGPLTETAAKLLLVHVGQKEITPLKANGTFRLWVKDGVLQKYETKLEGTLAIETNSARHEVTVHQRSTTTVKDLGTTKFDVPDEAKKKLEAGKVASARSR